MDGYRFRLNGDVLYANDVMDSTGRYNLDGDRIIMAFPHGSEGSSQAFAFKLPDGRIVMVAGTRCFLPIGRNGHIKKGRFRCNELVPPATME